METDDLKRLFHAIEKARNEAILLYTKADAKKTGDYYLSVAHDLAVIMDEIVAKVSILA